MHRLKMALPSPYAKHTDLNCLMVGIAAGDAAAFRHFWRATRGKVTATAFGILRDRERAEDVVQETYLVVWTKAGYYNEQKASPIAWVSSISRNRAIDQLRGPRARTSHVNLDVVENRADCSRSPEEQADMRQALRIALRRLDDLPPEEKALLTAAFINRTPYPVLAAELNMPLPTLKSKVRRAQIKFASAAKAVRT